MNWRNYLHQENALINPEHHRWFIFSNTKWGRGQGAWDSVWYGLILVLKSHSLVKRHKVKMTIKRWKLFCLICFLPKRAFFLFFFFYVRHPSRPPPSSTSLLVQFINSFMTRCCWTKSSWLQHLSPQCKLENNLVINNSTFSQAQVHNFSCLFWKKSHMSIWK